MDYRNKSGNDALRSTPFASSLTLTPPKPSFPQLPGHFITRKVCTRPKGPDLHPLASFAHGCFSLWDFTL